MNPLADFIKSKAFNRPVAEVLAEILRNRIIEGELLPGAKLVEAELAKHYGVSRGPIREALRSLGSEGLIDVEKHRSPTVKGLDASTFGEMFEIRSVLEGYGAKLAADRMKISKADMKWAKTALAGWKSGAYAISVEVHVQKNHEFHERLLEIANHNLLKAQVQSLIMPGYRTILEPMLTQEQMQTSTQQHIAILESLIDGDGARAEELMREHIGAAGKRVKQDFTTEFLDPRMNELRRLQSTG